MQSEVAHSEWTVTHIRGWLSISAKHPLIIRTESFILAVDLTIFDFMKISIQMLYKMRF